jgi:hypothetical protein
MCREGVQRSVFGGIGSGLNRVFGPKGQESIAQGLPWVLGLSPEALKGRPLMTHPGVAFRNAGRPLQGFITLERVTQGKPWAMLSWPLRATEDRLGEYFRHKCPETSSSNGQTSM